MMNKVRNVAYIAVVRNENETDEQFKNKRSAITTHFENMMANKHDGDCGLDLVIPNGSKVSSEGAMLSFDIIVQLEKETAFDVGGNAQAAVIQNIGYILCPRSSIYKTRLRQSNCVGIIDAGYRGCLKVPVDCVGAASSTVEPMTRLFQIVPFGGEGIHEVRIVSEEDLTNTTRGAGGFGSSNIWDGVKSEGISVEGGETKNLFDDIASDDSIVEEGADVKTIPCYLKAIL